jgi:hypothetical protein
MPSAGPDVKIMENVQGVTCVVKGGPGNQNTPNSQNSNLVVNLLVLVVAVDEEGNKLALNTQQTYSFAANPRNPNPPPNPNAPSQPTNPNQPNQPESPAGKFAK